MRRLRVFPGAPGALEAPNPAGAEVEDDDVGASSRALLCVVTLLLLLLLSTRLVPGAS